MTLARTTTFMICASITIMLWTTSNQALALPQTNPSSVDEKFAEIEAKVPGFSGLYFDEQGKLNILLKDAQKISPLQAALVLNEYLEPKAFQYGFNVMPAKQEWNQWLSWKHTLRDLFVEKDLDITALDIDEKNQKIIVGFSKLDLNKESKVQDFLKTRNIPTDMVSFVETGEIQLDTHENTVFNPRKGGIQIGIVGSTYCTNGFIAIRSSQTVSITNGHCEATVDSAADQQFTQPQGGSVIGTEVANSNIQGSRYSDTLRFAPTVSTALGKINKNGSDLTINGKIYFQTLGNYICKYGYQTHETCGVIRATAVDVSHPNYSVLFDQNTADYTRQGGDSGSPVYRHDGTSNISLFGIHWGVQSGTGYAFYSPIGNIETDQGTLQVK